MRMGFFGDSYDIVKLSFLRWLSEYGQWSIHPMFTEKVSDDDVVALERFFGAKIISKEVLGPETDRPAYFECGSHCGHLFLDPDTGLRMRPTKGKKGPKYVFASDLVHLSVQRAGSLTLVFDQSVARGSEREGLNAKLQQLRDQGLFGFAYTSHACFILASRDRGLLTDARRTLVEQSGLPEKRFFGLRWR